MIFRGILVASILLLPLGRACLGQRIDMPDYLGDGQTYAPGWTPTAPLQPVFPQAPPGYASAPFDPYGGGAYPPNSMLGAPSLGPYDTVAPTYPSGVGLSGAPVAPPGYDPYNGSAAFPTYNGSLAGVPYSSGTTMYDPYRSWDQWWNEQPVRFITGPRFAHTWVYGGNGRDVDIRDLDFSIVVAWPRFLWTQQPLHIAPSFSLHLWDGPQSPPPPPQGPDLPANAYSAFLDLGWESRPEAPFGAEVGVRVGVFSDFHRIQDDAFRIMGKGLLKARINERLALRGGVYYLNRERVELLPAFGVTWTPSPLTRFDLFFPKPKLSQYLSTVGANDLWWYLSGDYGGGVWSIRRAYGGPNDVVDINDIRIALGLEWGRPPQLRAGGRIGFIEVGWVTDRELFYQSGQKMDMPDTFMIRSGFGY